MEEVYGLLAERLERRAEAALPEGSRRVVVAIAGVPGSGKSTTSREVCRRLNAAEDQAVVVPMDGFHLYRRELDAMPDPAQAHARRGAPWTFNAAAFVTCLRAVRERDEVRVPSFDHGVGDPVEGNIIVRPCHRLALVEGNYLLLGAFQRGRGGKGVEGPKSLPHRADAQPWAEVRTLAHETWFVECALDAAMARVAARQAAIGVPPAVAAHRVATNDRPNAELVAATRGRADLVIPSLPLRAPPAAPAA